MYPHLCAHRLWDPHKGTKSLTAKLVDKAGCIVLNATENPMLFLPFL